ncbi:MAG: hypothetical protein IPM54_21310 [Polyangiaceae bacterium]|nr:hypothetical protein [Polyangiaceae bacterium]
MGRKMQFYVLKVQVGAPHETRYNEMKPVQEGEAPICPACGGYVGMIPTLPPFRAELVAYGKELGDVAFGPGDNLLVSDRFRQAWESANLRGLVFSPLERIRIRPARLGKKPATYFHVAPQLFGTQVDLERSRLEHEELIQCNKCKYGGLLLSIRGFAIDEKSWTGEDIFRPWGLSGDIVVTDRVRKLRDDHGLTNMNLTRVEELFWDPYYRWSVDGVSPPDWHDGPDDQRAAN